MSTSPLRDSCPRCGKRIPKSSPAGLCPGCLLRGAKAPEGAAGRDYPAPGFLAPSPVELQQLLAGYEVIDLIGRGGMGAVYRGRHRRLDREVAIKILPLEVAGDPDRRERFIREARAMAKLQHPGIVTVFNADEAGEEFLFIEMELVDGPDLDKLMRSKALSTAEALDIVTQIGEALEFAHGLDIVHRDIKPANILRQREGRVKVADFGLVKMGDDPNSASLTRSTISLGTPDYLAPEAKTMGSANVDHRADIYALGVVLYQLLTGKLPVGAWEAPSTLNAEVGEEVDRIVTRALQNDREKRYQEIGEMARDLRAAWNARSGQKTEIVEIAPGRAEARPPRRWSKLLLAGLLLTAAAGLAAAIWLSKEPPLPPSEPLPPTPWTSGLTVGPGEFTGGEVVIKINLPRNVEPVHEIEIRPRTRLEKVAWLVDFGSITAIGTSFVDCHLQQDMHAKMTAKDCLFDRTRLRKGGNWFGDLWSAKWEFDNCVFAAEFFKRLNTVDVSVRAEFCTFYDLNFPKIEYKVDAGVEAADPLLAFRRCRFVDCVIPFSLLLATEDCHFERCEFEPAPANLPGESGHSVRFAISSGETPAAAPEGTTRFSLTAAPAEEIGPAGATLRHVYDGESLKAGN